MRKCRNSAFYSNWNSSFWITTLHYCFGNCQGGSSFQLKCRKYKGSCLVKIKILLRLPIFMNRLQYSFTKSKSPEAAIQTGMSDQEFESFIEYQMQFGNNARLINIKFLMIKVVLSLNIVFILIFVKRLQVTIIQFNKFNLWNFVLFHLQLRTISLCRASLLCLSPSDCRLSTGL